MSAMKRNAEEKAGAAVVRQVVDLAVRLSADQMERLADAVARFGDEEPAYARIRILDAFPQPRVAAGVTELLDLWASTPDLKADALALALRAAGATADHYRGEQQVDLVWTGPVTHRIPLRRTEQALLQVIYAAQGELLIVSFAVYKADAVIQALIAAFERGVHLRICVEAPDPEGRTMAYDTIQALGADVRQRAEVYVWPRTQRPLGTNGKPGSLHAKLAVADQSHLFVSSANLTAYAMSINMELGVLIQGGSLPGRVAAHFSDLILEGVLQPAERRGGCDPPSWKLQASRKIRIRLLRIAGQLCQQVQYLDIEPDEGRHQAERPVPFHHFGCAGCRSIFDALEIEEQIHCGQYHNHNTEGDADGPLLWM